MANYKVNFTEIELEALTKIKRQDKRESAMKVFSKMKKYSDENGFVYRTITDILKLITRTSKMTRSYLYKLLTTLTELGLIEKGSKNGEYFISKNKVVEKTVDIEKQPKNVENKGLEVYLEKRNYRELNKTYTNTLDIVPIVEVIKTTKDILKTLNLKRSSREFIEKLIKSRLVDYDIKVNRVGLEKYVFTMVKEKLSYLGSFSNNRTDKSVIRALEKLSLEVA